MKHVFLSATRYYFCIIMKQHIDIGVNIGITVKGTQLFDEITLDMVYFAKTKRLDN